MRLNHYERKRQHKRELKKKHAVRYSVFDPGFDERKAKEDFARDLEEGYHWKWQDPRNDGYNYWIDFSLSGPRQYAKDCTNRRIRSKFKQLLAKEEFENIMTLQGSDYEKEYDYWWTIY